MENKVICVVTEAAPQKCDGDSGESPPKVSLVTGHDGISYHEHTQQEQTERNSIDESKIFPPIGYDASKKCETVKKSAHHNPNMQEIGAIFDHDISGHEISGHIISGHKIFSQVLISIKKQTLVSSSPNDHDVNSSHVVQEPSRIGEQVSSEGENRSLQQKIMAE